MANNFILADNQSLSWSFLSSTAEIVEEMAKEANNNAGEIISITAEKLTREDTIVVNELGAIIEKGLVLHGANPAVNVGDALVAVNGEQFASIEDLTQLFTKATTEGKALQLQFSRVKQQQAKIIERVIVEIIRENDNDQLGVTLGSDGDFVVVTAVEGVAAAAGIKVNDAVIYVNGERLFTATDFAKLQEGQKKVVFKLKRGGKRGTKVEFEEKALTLRIPFSAGDFLGIQMNKDIVVTKIQPGSCGEEKFEVNDRIVEINNMKFRDNNQVYKFLERCDDDLTIVVMRQVPKDPDANKPATEADLVMLSLQMAPFEPIGVRPDEKMLVSTIHKGSHGEGRFELGDIIKSINGVVVTDRNQFFKLFESATCNKRVEVIVERSASREAELEMHQLPPNIEKIIKRHAGYQYLMANIKYTPKPGKIFGLQIANVTSHKIVVPEVTENSVAGDYLKGGDHIIAINGTPVSDMNIAKKMIKDCRACFQAVIARPTTFETLQSVKKEIEEWKKRMNKPATPKNMEEMPVDVQEIITTLMTKRQAGPVQPKYPSAFRKPTRTAKGIQFQDKHVETQIQSDVNPNKTLRPCK